MSDGARLELVWFKRDLRVADHGPLVAACARAKATGGWVLGFYAIEPSVQSAPDYAARQWEATREALAQLQKNLATLGLPFAVRKGEAVELLERLRAHAARRGARLALWSHEETGNGVTYARDRAVKRWTREQGVEWTELFQFGVVRPLASREGWAASWEERMRQPMLAAPQFGCARGWTGAAEAELPSARELGLATDPCPGRQSGGEAEANRLLASFLAYRGKDYSREMSSPRTAADACSRLSVPLALGAISLRTVAQAATARAEELRTAHPAAAGGQTHIKGFRIGSVRSFSARLHWHCHFMQKLEDEPRIETQAFLPALDELRAGAWTDEAEARLEAWDHGRTGYPFIDACIRSLRATGWINFRMRAMLMSFASYDLWLPWRASGLRLARLFTDYEPGIHWPQVQMQSGTTGINTLRMYSPLKQSVDQDPGGEFIRRWVPELEAVPSVFIHEPWRMPTAAQHASGCVIGVSYPRPISDHPEAVRHAREKFSEVKRRAEHRAEARAVFVRHGSRKRPGTETVEPRWFEGPNGKSEPAGLVGKQLELGL